MDSLDLQKKLDWILQTQLEDNVKARQLLPDGTYLPKENHLPPCCSQEVFQEVFPETKTIVPPAEKPSLWKQLSAFFGKKNH